MKRIQQKAKLPTPKPITIKLSQQELKGMIVLPKVRYEVVASVENDCVFQGEVLPIPKILIYFLSKNELMVLSLIMDEESKNGECTLPVKEINRILKLSCATISNVLYSLRRIGLLKERSSSVRGAGRIRKLNYEAIQHLNDLLDGEMVGVYPRVRKATRKTDITHLTKEDIFGAYDNVTHAPDDDPSEDEEYD